MRSWNITKSIIKPIKLLNQCERNNLKTLLVSPLWYITALPFMGEGCFDQKPKPLISNKDKEKSEVNTASKLETPEAGKDTALTQGASETPKLNIPSSPLLARNSTKQQQQPAAAGTGKKKIRWLDEELTKKKNLKAK